MNAMHILRVDLDPKQLTDVIDFCRETGIGEVMLFTGGPQWYARPQTVSQAQAWVDSMRDVVSVLREHKLRVSINVWYTLGHGTGDDWVKQSSFQPQVGINGEPVWDVVCPLDEAWQREIAVLYGLYASLNPDAIWIDDDFRYHHHPPATWTCFCPLHLSATTTILGSAMSQQQLIENIRLHHDIHIVKAWQQSLQMGLNRLARKIVKQVRQVNGQIRVGLMTSSPEKHGAEGRRWADLETILAYDNEPLMIRPTLGNYTGSDPRDIIQGTLLAVRTVERLPRSFVYPEIENYPYSPWNKSGRYLRLQILASAAYRMDEFAFDLFPYGGQNVSFDAGLREELKNILSELRLIRQHFTELKNWRLRGVGVPLVKDECIGTSFPGNEEPRLWDLPFSLLGFGITFDPNTPVIALSASLITQMSEGELRSCFERGVILDASAVEAMSNRGLEWLSNCTVHEDYQGIAYECLTEEGGLLRDLRIDRVALSRVTPNDDKSAQIKTQVINNEGRVLGPGMLWLRNRLGGRVVVVADRGVLGGLQRMSYRNYSWQRLWWQALNWLSNDAIPVAVHRAPDVVPVRWDNDAGTLVTLINVSSDVRKNVELSIGGIPNVVPKTGHWWAGQRWIRVSLEHENRENQWTVQVPQVIHPMDVTWLWIPWVA
jgi:hypothetical protein